MLCFCFTLLFLLHASLAFAQCDSVDLAVGRPASASSVQDGNTVAFDPSHAFDGDTINSRWSSAFSDPQYIYVDLGQTYNLCQVKLFWENAYGSEYTIDGTNDTTLGWTTLAHITGNTSLLNTIPVTGSYRFVRMFGIARATGFGYSLIAMQVMGFPPACNPANIALNQPVTSSSDESGAFPASAVNDGDINTRWASGFTDNEFITINLGGSYPLCRATFHWFNDTYPSSFAIDLSNDGSTFTPDTVLTGNTQGYNVINLNGSAQYVRMRGITRNNTTVGYSLEEFLIMASGTLPVKLIGFTAIAEGQQRVLLSWTTEIETNNAYFDLERSTDGTHYNSIGRVPGAGNSSTPLNYHWIDSLPLKGKDFYRLKQVDLDGKSVYSDITTIIIGSSLGDKLSLYPNPTRETVNIVNPSGLLIREIKVYNIEGVEVKRFSPLANNMTIQLSIGDLPAGLYTLKLLTDNGAETLKVFHSL